MKRHFGCIIEICMTKGAQNYSMIEKPRGRATNNLTRKITKTWPRGVKGSKLGFQERNQDFSYRLDYNGPL